MSVTALGVKVTHLGAFLLKGKAEELIPLPFPFICILPILILSVACFCGWVGCCCPVLLRICIWFGIGSFFGMFWLVGLLLFVFAGFFLCLVTLLLHSWYKVQRVYETHFAIVAKSIILEVLLSFLLKECDRFYLLLIYSFPYSIFILFSRVKERVALYQ